MEKRAKEHPILFSGPLVRAILDGRKTQTRRLVRPPRGEGWRPVGKMIRTKADLSDPAFRWDRAGAFGATQWVEDRCPFGSPGDRLWVREAWRVGAWRADGRFALDYAAGPTERTPWLQPPPEVGARLAEQSVYDCARAKAAGDTRIREEGDRYVWGVGDSPCRWRPSIHMPKWASRLSLEVTEVRVQRVQDIDEDDARAEGCESTDVIKPESCRSAFEALWDSLAPEGQKWADNPWVWAVSFKRLNGGSDV